MGLRDRLSQLETRAGNIMMELRTIDNGDIECFTDTLEGQLDNERWLSEELEETGEIYDDHEKALRMTRK